MLHPNFQYSGPPGTNMQGVHQVLQAAESVRAHPAGVGHSYLYINGPNIIYSVSVKLVLV